MHKRVRDPQLEVGSMHTPHCTVLYVIEVSHQPHNLLLPRSFQDFILCLLQSWHIPMLASLSFLFFQGNFLDPSVVRI